MDPYCLAPKLTLAPEVSTGWPTFGPHLRGEGNMGAKSEVWGPKVPDSEYSIIIELCFALRH